MKTLQLSEQKARELYRSGSKELKTVLEESFGKDFFSQDVTERVKTYLDACHELGREPLDEKKLLELGLTVIPWCSSPRRKYSNRISRNSVHTVFLIAVSIQHPLTQRR